MQLPPSHPWQPPASVMIAVLPSCAELAGSRRTTTAITNGSPFRASSAASCRISARISVRSLHQLLHPREVPWFVKVGERFDRPRRRLRLLTMALHHVLAAALSFERR